MQVDALLGEASLPTEHETSRNMRTEFMQLWDGLLRARRVLVVAATNQPDRLPDSIWRRFSAHFEVCSRPRILQDTAVSVLQGAAFRTDAGWFQEHRITTPSHRACGLKPRRRLHSASLAGPPRAAQQSGSCCPTVPSRRRSSSPHARGDECPRACTACVPRGVDQAALPVPHQMSQAGQPTDYAAGNGEADNSTPHAHPLFLPVRRCRFLQPRRAPRFYERR
jgi:hypothetical protein